MAIAEGAFYELPNGVGRPRSDPLKTLSSHLLLLPSSRPPALPDLLGSPSSPPPPPLYPSALSPITLTNNLTNLGGRLFVGTRRPSSVVIYDTSNGSVVQVRTRYLGLRLQPQLHRRPRPRPCLVGPDLVPGPESLSPTRWCHARAIATIYIGMRCETVYMCWEAKGA